MQIAIVLYPGVTALDAIGPYEILHRIPGAQLRFVGTEAGPVDADSGVLFLGVTHTYAETPEPDIVLVPGSERATPMAMASEELTSWLHKVHKKTIWTTSVCSGALILASAGILEGQSATTHWLVQPALARLGAKPEPGQRIVRSGKIATAAGVSAGLDLALWLVGELCGPERAEIIQLVIEYDPEPPFDSGHPAKASKEVRRKAQADMIRAGSAGATARAVPRFL